MAHRMMSLYPVNLDFGALPGIGYAQKFDGKYVFDEKAVYRKRAGPTTSRCTRCPSDAD